MKDIIHKNNVNNNNIKLKFNKIKINTKITFHFLKRKHD